jgi:hypothetical protein
VLGGGGRVDHLGGFRRLGELRGRYQGPMGRLANPPADTLRRAPDRRLDPDVRPNSRGVCPWWWLIVLAGDLTQGDKGTVMGL